MGQIVLQTMQAVPKPTCSAVALGATPKALQPRVASELKAHQPAAGAIDVDEEDETWGGWPKASAPRAAEPKPKAAEPKPKVAMYKVRACPRRWLDEPEHSGSEEVQIL